MTDWIRCATISIRQVTCIGREIGSSAAPAIWVVAAVSGQNTLRCWRRNWLKKADQKIAACGSSYILSRVGAAEGCDLLLLRF